MGFTLLLATIVHLALLLGVSFTLPGPNLVSKTLDITIASFKSAEKPKKADYLAQHDQQGSGSLEHKATPKTTELAPFQDSQIRKVEPLKRALAGRGAWITGQRRQQSTTRGELPLEEHDATFGLYKFNPLAEWSEEEIWAVIRALGIPYNPLHDQGYPSIGCEPCTRAIRPGEDLRAGRWWWESSDSKECGLHAGNRVISVVARGD